MTSQEISEKFMNLAGHSVGAATALRIADVVATLEALDSTNGLTDLLVAAKK